MSDIELLRDYAKNGAEQAFTEVANRYRALVYSAALRQTGNSATAEEITQAVFIIMARKAGSLHPKTVLSGWLLRTTRHLALNLRRREMRRNQYEIQAYELLTADEKHD